MMEEKRPAGISSAQQTDFSAWKEFQAGLTAFLDIPIALYDSGGEQLVPPSRTGCVCDAAGSDEKASRRCVEVRRQAIEQVVSKNKVYVYKCHVNQYIFAVPVKIEDGQFFVIIGGHAYLEGSGAKDSHEGISTLGLGDKAVSDLRANLKTIPSQAIFSLPGIVQSLASPFLKSLYSKNWGFSPEQAAQGPFVARYSGLDALDEGYRSIAPVLDKEELYETILEKSTELVGAERGSLMIIDSKNNVLSIKAAKGLDRRDFGNIRVRLGEGIAGNTAINGVPVVVRDIEEELPSHKSAQQYKTKSFISLPLKLEDRVIGVINISDKITGDVFSDGDMALLRSFSNYASIALERGAYYSLTEELKALSMTDPLTGLFNRRYFRERIFEEVERARRHNERFTVFLIDIDDFKAFNDKYGHLTGDDIIQSVSHAIRDAVRSMDVVARYGGEEFAVILPHTGKKEAAIIAERVRKGVAGSKVAAAGASVSSTVSIGVAEFLQDAASIDDLVNNADMAMYRAKRAGKNRVVMHGE